MKLFWNGNSLDPASLDNVENGAKFDITYFSFFLVNHKSRFPSLINGFKTPR